MKILVTSDIHQMISKWKSLIEACKKERPDVVCIAGDLAPKDTYITGQMPFFQHMEKYAKQIKETGAEILIILGNDDNQRLIPLMEGSSLWHYIPEKVVEINGHEFAAMPYVPDYPFGYKFWCRGEFKDALRIDPVQFTKPVLVGENGKFEVIKDYKKYLESQETIWESLNKTAKLIKNMSKSIWMIHCPPSNMELDVCAHGAKVGSGAVYKFIQEQQPLITIHGHIHESPIYNGKKWYQQEGNTLCVQCGQVGFDLHYAIIQIENGMITSKGHSLYGN